MLQITKEVSRTAVEKIRWKVRGQEVTLGWELHIVGIAGDTKNFSFFLKSKMVNQWRILRYDLLYI